MLWERQWHVSWSLFYLDSYRVGLGEPTIDYAFGTDCCIYFVWQDAVFVTERVLMEEYWVRSYFLTNIYIFKSVWSIHNAVEHGKSSHAPISGSNLRCLAKTRSVIVPKIIDKGRDVETNLLRSFISMFLINIRFLLKSPIYNTDDDENRDNRL